MSYHRFSIIQGRAVVDRRLTNAQFRTLGALGMYADVDGWCFPSQTSIGEDLGKSRQMVNEDIAKLVEFGYVEKHPRPMPNKKISLRYRLLHDTIPARDVGSHPQDVSILPDSNDPSNDPSLNTLGSDKSSPDLPIEWQIASGKKIDKMPNQVLAERKDAASLIATGTGVVRDEIYNIAMAFQSARGITLSNEEAKANRKAAKHMFSMGVKPSHISQAVNKLIEEKMTVVNLFSVLKTAVDLANPAKASKPISVEVRK